MVGTVANESYSKKPSLLASYEALAMNSFLATEAPAEKERDSAKQQVAILSRGIEQLNYAPAEDLKPFMDELRVSGPGYITYHGKAVKPGSKEIEEMYLRHAVREESEYILSAVASRRWGSRSIKEEKVDPKRIMELEKGKVKKYADGLIRKLADKYKNADPELIKKDVYETVKVEEGKFESYVGASQSSVEKIGALMNVYNFVTNVVKQKYDPYLSDEPKKEPKEPKREPEREPGREPKKGRP